MSEIPQASLERDEPDEGGRAGVLLRTPYDETFISDLKSSIPAADRKWLKDRGAWWVAAEHEQLATELAGFAFGAVIVIDADGDEIVERDGRRTGQGRLF